MAALIQFLRLKYSVLIRWHEQLAKLSSCRPPSLPQHRCMHLNSLDIVYTLIILPCDKCVQRGQKSCVRHSCLVFLVCNFIFDYTTSVKCIQSSFKCILSSAFVQCCSLMFSTQSHVKVLGFYHKNQATHKNRYKNILQILCLTSKSNMRFAQMAIETMMCDERTQSAIETTICDEHIQKREHHESKCDSE